MGMPWASAVLRDQVSVGPVADPGCEDPTARLQKVHSLMLL